MNKEVAFNSNKEPTKCLKTRRSAIKSAELPKEHDFMNRFAEEENGTLSAVDLIPVQLVANWIERCNGGNICIRSKFLNTSVNDILFAVIFVTDFDPRRQYIYRLWRGAQGVPSAVVTLLAILTIPEDPSE